MKPAPFCYHAPATLADALDLLAAHGDEAKVLAGGQSLVPMLNFRLVSPRHIVDINRLPDLDAVERDAGVWRIPALVRQRAIERSTELAACLPLLHEAVGQVAHAQIRNRGTVCGSLAHADAAGELPAAMLALEARLTLMTRSTTRVVSADDFFVFHLTTALGPDEMLVRAEVDELAPRTYSSFQEFAPRQGDFCLAGIAAVVTLDTAGIVTRVRLVAAGVAPTPLRLVLAERALVGAALVDGVLADAAAAAGSEANPSADIRADAAYRKQLVGVLTRRALARVRARAEADHDG